MKNFRLSAIILFSCLFAGLSQPVQAENDSRQRQQPPVEKIYGGIPTDLSGTSVALISNLVGSFSCSGILVGTQTVLTAGHCIVLAIEGSSLIVVTVGGFSYLVTDVAIHPLYQGLNDVSDSNSRFDLGILQLEHPVTNVLPMPILYKNILTRRQLIGVAGFGTNNNGIPSGDYPTGEVATLLVQKVSDGLLTASEGDTGAIPCKGDSGGAGFMRTGGTLVTVGIISIGNSSAIGSECFANPSSFASLVNLLSSYSQTFLGKFRNIQWYSPDLPTYSKYIKQAKKDLTQLKRKLTTSSVKKTIPKVVSKLKQARKIANPYSKNVLTSVMFELNIQARGDASKDKSVVVAQINQALANLTAIQ